jgi:hypothetical protein
VGDGTGTFFWTGPWLDETPLCERFPRFFTLAENGSSTVAEVFHLGWGIVVEACVWRRQLWAWEEGLLRECQTLLHDFFLQAQSPDRWLWQPDPDNGYTVWGAYQLLTSHPPVSLDPATDLICHKQVSLKVSVFAWRLLRHRLPTKFGGSEHHPSRGLVLCGGLQCCGVTSAFIHYKKT